MVVICEGAILEGPVTFASKSSQSQTPQAHSVEWIEDDEMPTIVHPKAQIRSIGAGGGGGAIVMGVGCIVMEHAQIINESAAPMVIGDYNIFEVGCVFKGQRCGNQNVFEAKSRVECCVGSHCVIAPTVTLLSSHPALVNISSSDEQLPLSSLPTTYLQDGSVAFHCRSNSSLNWTTTTTTVRCAGVKPYRESSSFGLHIRHIEYLKETLPKFHNLVVHSPIHS